MIARVWDQCCKAVCAEQVYVATDDDRIADHCRGEGIQIVMTPDDCLTGTDRVQNAATRIDADIYINVQGDEPMILPDDINAVIAAAEASPGPIINAMCPIETEEDFRSTTVPKVVARPDGRLMYMSRAPIPTDKAHGFQGAMKQVCIYAFTREALNAFAARDTKTPLEAIEDIEILRFLELGFEVEMIEVSGASIAVDVPEDVARVERALAAAD